MTKLRQVHEDFRAKKEEIQTAQKIVSNLPQFELDLPSRGIFYADKNSKVTVTALTVKQIREIHAASSLNSMYDKEAQFISALSSSVVSKSIYDLTLGDYDFIRYWIRLNTYKKSPIKIKWDNNGKEVLSSVTDTNLSVVEIDKHFVPDRRMAFTTVRDYLDMLKMEDEAEKYVASWASYLIGKDLQEKIIKLNSMDAADIIPDIRDYVSKSAHGVNEFVNLSDPDTPDKLPVRVELKLEASDFFP